MFFTPIHECLMIFHLPLPSAVAQVSQALCDVVAAVEGSLLIVLFAHLSLSLSLSCARLEKLCKQGMHLVNQFTAPWEALRNNLIAEFASAGNHNSDGRLPSHGNGNNYSNKEHNHNWFAEKTADNFPSRDACMEYNYYQHVLCHIVT